MTSDFTCLDGLKENNAGIHKLQFSGGSKIFPVEERVLEPQLCV